MDDARTRHATDAGEARPAMSDQRIDESALSMASAWMHDEAGRLVDDDEGVVLIDDVERDRLRRGRRGREGGQSELEALARFDPVFWVLYGRPAACHLPLLDQSLQPRAA